MRRAVAVAVVEFDAVRRGAAEEGGVEQVGAALASRHRDFPGRPHRLDDVLGLRRDAAARAGDHHADGVEQMPPRVVPRVLRQRVVAQRAGELHDLIGRARGGLQRVDGFGVGHGVLRISREAYAAPRIFSSTGSR